MLRVSDVCGEIEKIAPKKWAFEFDKVGLQVGRMDAPVTKIAFSLDSSLAAAKFAASVSAQLLISHHPLFFHPMKDMVLGRHQQDTVSELVRNGTSFIACHTNWDAAPGGVNDALAAVLDLSEIEEFGSAASSVEADRQPCGRVGQVRNPVSAAAFQSFLDAKLGSRSQIWVPDNLGVVERVAVVGGAAGNEWEYAKETGAQMFVSGEIPHHIGVEASASGLAVVAAGHYHTEQPGVVALAKRIRSGLGVDCVVFEPESGLDGRPF